MAYASNGIVKLASLQKNWQDCKKQKTSTDVSVSVTLACLRLVIPNIKINSFRVLIQRKGIKMMQMCNGKLTQHAGQMNPCPNPSQGVPVLHVVQQVSILHSNQNCSIWTPIKVQSHLLGDFHPRGMGRSGLSTLLLERAECFTKLTPTVIRKYYNVSPWPYLTY